MIQRQAPDGEAVACGGGLYHLIVEVEAQDGGTHGRLDAEHWAPIVPPYLGAWLVVVFDQHLRLQCGGVVGNALRQRRAGDGHDLLFE